MTNDKGQMTIGKWLSLLLTLVLAAAVQAQTAPPTTAPDFQSVIARQASLVSEFDVNGLKVLVKRREGSQTVAVQFYIRGGAENVTATNAGVEAFMLNVASEASANYPRDRMRKELARMGTAIGESVNYDYSALAMAATRTNFDKSWDIFADVATNPAFTTGDVALVKTRLVASLSGDTDEPDTYLQRLQEKVAYDVHPYR